MGTIRNLGFEVGSPTPGDADGWAIRGSTENRLTYSESFADWDASGVTVDANSGARVPEGPTATASDRLKETAANAPHRVSAANASTTGWGSLGKATLSVFVLPGTRSWVMLDARDEDGNVSQAWFDLSTGAVGTVASVGGVFTATARIDALDDGWFRCAITVSAIPVTSAQIGCSVFAATGDTNTGYLGVAGDVALSVNGGQLVVGVLPGDYQRTDAVAVVAALLPAEFVAGENMIPFSEDADGTLGWVVDQGTIEHGTGSTPPGLANPADKFKESGATSAHLCYPVLPADHARFGTLYWGSATTITWTFHVKAGTRSWCFVGPRFGTGYASGGSVWFNLATGVMGSIATDGGTMDATIDDIGSGWYRITVTQRAIVTNDGFVICFLAPAPSDGGVSYAGVNGDTSLEFTATQAVRASSPGPYTATFGVMADGRTAVEAFETCWQNDYAAFDIAAVPRETARWGTSLASVEGFEREWANTPFLSSSFNRSERDFHSFENFARYSDDLDETRVIDGDAYPVWNKYGGAIQTGGPASPVHPYAPTFALAESTAGGAGGYHAIEQYEIASDTGLRTLSAVVKAGTRSWCILGIYSPTATWEVDAWFNLGAGTTGTINRSAAATADGTATSAIEALGDGWFRVSVTTPKKRAQYSGLLVSPSTGDGVFNYAGVADAIGIYATHVQIEAGATPSSIVRTWADATPRPADAVKAEMFDRGWGVNDHFLTADIGEAEDAAFGPENLLVWSEALDNAAWVPALGFVLADGGDTPPVGPPGASDVFVENGATGYHAITQTVVEPNGGWGTVVTVSAFLKQGTRPRATFYLAYNGPSAGLDCWAWFKLSDGTVGTVGGDVGTTTSAIVDVGGGWYHCSIKQVYTPPAGAYLDVSIQPSQNDANSSFTGTDGNHSTMMAGAQLARSATLPKYIGTEDARTGPTETFGGDWRGNDAYKTAFVGIGTDLTAAVFAGQRALSVENFENVLAPQRFGDGAAITVDTTNDLFNYTTHPFGADYKLAFTIDQGLDGGTIGALPGGLSSAQYYYATTILTNSFKLHNLIGDSSVVNITSAPAGIVYLKAPGEFWTQILDGF